MPRERVRKKKGAAAGSPAVTPQPTNAQQRPFSVSPGDSSCSSDSLFSGGGNGGHPGPYSVPQQQHPYHAPYPHPNHHYPQQQQQQQHHPHHQMMGPGGGGPMGMHPGHPLHHGHPHGHPNQQQQLPGPPQQMQHHGGHYGGMHGGGGGPMGPGPLYSCSKCHKAINERTVSMCDNRFWHAACLTCQMCGHTPSPHSGESLYAYRGSLICKQDYIRINCVCKCCSRPITQEELVIRAGKNVGWVHEKCIFCRQCNTRLRPGDHYWWTTDNMLVCQKCIGPNGGAGLPGGGPNGGAGMMMGQGGPAGGPGGPMEQMYHSGGHMPGPGQHPGQHMMMGPGGGRGGMGGPANSYMGQNGPMMGPNGQMIKMEPMMGPNGQMIKMEPNGYGNGLPSNGMHMGGGGGGHMNHLGGHQTGPGTPGATPTPPPPTTTTTGGRRGRKKATPAAQQQQQQM